MRNGLFGAVAVFLAWSGMGAAQLPPPAPPPDAPQFPAAPTNPGGAWPRAFPEGTPPLPAPQGGPPAPGVAELVAPAPPADDLFRPTQAASAYPFYGWTRAEYLLWAVKKGAQAPPLVTTGPSTADTPAALSELTTTVLFPSRPVDYHSFEGGRFAAGAWFDPCQTFGAEVAGMMLGQESRTYPFGSGAGGSPVLGLPFVDALTGREAVHYVAFPGRLAGGVEATSAARLWGMEGTCYADWGETTLRLGDSNCPLGDLRTHLLGGFRFLSLDETVGLDQSSRVLAAGAADLNGAPLLAGDVITIRDGFAVRSEFFGGQVGLRSEFDRGPFYAEFTGKLGLGDSHESIRVNGSTTLLPAATGIPVVASGGFLATATNSGRRVRDQFAVVPEAGINLGWQPCPLVRFFVGYTFVYWSDVVRAADQIDRTVNVTAVPSSGTFGTLTGPARPSVPFRTTDFWAQGVNFGFELRH